MNAMKLPSAILMSFLFLVLQGGVPLKAAPSTIKKLHEMDADGLRVNAVSFSRDGRFLASAYEGAHIHVWNPKTGEELRTLAPTIGPLKQLYQLMTGVPPPTNDLEFAPKPPWGSSLLAAAYRDGVRLWNARTGELVRRLKRVPDQNLTSLAFSPEGVFLAAGSLRGMVTVWNTRSNKVMRRFRAHGNNTVTHLAFSPVPVGKYLATGTSDGQIRVWNWKKALGDTQITNNPENFKVAEFSTFQKETPFLRDVAGLGFRGNSADSLTLITGALDGTMRFWSIPEGELQRELMIKFVDGFQISPDGTLFALANGDTLQVRSFPTNDLLAQGKEHTNVITSIEFSPSGKWIATGSGEVNPPERDDRVILWKNPFFEPGPPGRGNPPPGTPGPPPGRQGANP